MHSEIAKIQESTLFRPACLLISDTTSSLPESVIEILVKISLIRKLFARIAFDRANDANCSWRWEDGHCT